MARRIFEFDGKSWEEGIDPAMTVREVQQDLAYYYPRLATMIPEEKTEGEDDNAVVRITFRERQAVKGVLGRPHPDDLGVDSAAASLAEALALLPPATWAIYDLYRAMAGMTAAELINVPPEEIADAVREAEEEASTVASLSRALLGLAPHTPGPR